MKGGGTDVEGEPKFWCIWFLKNPYGDLGLRASTVGGTGSIPGRGTKIPHATQRRQKNRKKLKKNPYGYFILTPTQELVFHVKYFFFLKCIIRYVCDTVRNDSSLNVFFVLCNYTLYF